MITDGVEAGAQRTNMQDRHIVSERYQNVYRTSIRDDEDYGASATDVQRRVQGCVSSECFNSRRRR